MDSCSCPVSGGRIHKCLLPTRFWATKPLLSGFNVVFFLDRFAKHALTPLTPSSLSLGNDAAIAANTTRTATCKSSDIGRQQKCDQPENCSSALRLRQLLFDKPIHVG